VPSLFINGEWIASGNGERSTVINPSDATVVTEVDVATDAHGTVWINDYNTYLPQAEWGGFKQPGLGRELGPSGLDEYRETKHIWQNLPPGPTGWFGG
jgi:acyl-CoA reductase-like NAD-dependent aldehyde dehydrogenase